MAGGPEVQGSLGYVFFLPGPLSIILILLPSPKTNGRTVRLAALSVSCRLSGQLFEDGLGEAVQESVMEEGQGHRALGLH